MLKQKLLSPLAFAVFTGKKDAFKRMLESKLSLDQELGNGNRLIHFAMSAIEKESPELADKLDILKIILDSVPDVNVLNNEVVSLLSTERESTTLRCCIEYKGISRNVIG